MNTNKTGLSVAIAGVLGLGAQATAADVIGMNFTGWFTFVNTSGTTAYINYDETGAPYYGRRTAVTGTLSFDTTTGAGSGSINGFSFEGSGLAEMTGISLQAIGDGFGGPGTLALGNMSFNWNGTTGIPVDLVWDAAGLMSALGGLTTGDTIGTGCTGCVAGWSENLVFDFFTGFGTYVLPMGTVPLATTSWNTSDIGTPTVGTNPSGTLPLIADTIGGSPMKTAPLQGFNINIDISTLQVTSVTSVPLPAAIWLFGSGLLGLAGVARRKQA